MSSRPEYYCIHCFAAVPQFCVCQPDCFCRNSTCQIYVDQLNPIPNNLPIIPDLVIKDITARAELGKTRYGTYLQPHNGRDSLQDAYEEAQDLCQYLRQVIWERDSK